MNCFQMAKQGKEVWVVVCVTITVRQRSFFVFVNCQIQVHSTVLNVKILPETTKLKLYFILIKVLVITPGTNSYLSEDERYFCS